MTQSTYYICEMKDAKDGLGIVAKEYYHSPISDKGNKSKPFTNKIAFEGNLDDCREKKRRLINATK